MAERRWLREREEKDVFRGMFILAPEGKIWNSLVFIFPFLITWAPDTQAAKAENDNLVVFMLVDDGE